jgi:hemerythrin-like domain-containing protein
MKPRGPLMTEHRLIEKMLKIAEKEIQAIKISGKADPVFIDTMVDFIRTYADRTHHGKEEDILFKELEKKEMNEGHRKMMKGLVEDHIYARDIVKGLIESKIEYVNGNHHGINGIIDKMTVLIHFYPEHIRKEDKEFFPETEAYFTPGELDAMLDAFWDFDRKMIHEKYEKLYATLSGNYK